MFSRKREYEVSDPAFYDSLITAQKKRVRQHSQDAREWLELGRLCEAKIDMIQYFARRNWGIRLFIPIYTVLILSSVCIGYFVFSNPNLTPFLFIIIMLTAIFTVILLRWLWLLRYPPSGAKYFKKAIELDPQCGDAYMHLGLIAFRRYQKREACLLLEQAIRLNAGNKAKQLDKEMKHHVSSIHQDYENKIAVLQEEAKAEAQELAQRDFIRLTTKILESKAGLEEQSFTAAARATENIVGKRSWQAFSEQTRTYLATAEQVYTVLAEQEEKPDGVNI